MNKIIFIVFSVLIFLPGCFAVDKFEEKRKSMVKNQITRRGVRDPKVLTAMNKVPREKFVPFGVKNSAYEDNPLPIGYEQTISQPYIVAYMTEALRLKKSDRVLEIGTGSGYQAAILGEIVKEVYTIEIVPPLGKRAKKLLKGLGYKNIHVKIGDGYHGWKEHAPFDAIILTAAPPKVPRPLIEQLSEGGRLIAPVGRFFQELVLITKRKGKTITNSLIPVRFVPMTGTAQDKK